MRVLSSSAHVTPIGGHHGGTMSLVLKILLGAVGALVAVSVATGLVAASSAEDPAPRETIVVDTANQRSPDGRTTGTKQKDTKDERDDRGEAQDDHGGDDHGGDDDIDTARVEPDDLDDDADDADDDGRDDDRDDDGDD